MKSKIICILVAIAIIPGGVLGCSNGEIKSNKITNPKIGFYELVDYFEDHIQDQYPGDDISKSYSKFFDAISSAGSLEEMRKILNMSGKRQKEIFSKIGRNKLSEVWTLKRGADLKIESINLKGSYLKIIEKACKEEVILQDYYDSIKIMGDISPRCVEILKEKSQGLNLDNKHVRLILAVHYFSINKDVCQ